MRLQFKQEFVKPILACFQPDKFPRIRPKIHAFLEDSQNKWMPGKPIEFSSIPPTKNGECFYAGKKAVCISTQNVIIKYVPGNFIPKIFIDGRELSYCEMVELALNDGFKRSSQLVDWFNKEWNGKLIHWTNKRY